MRNSKGQFVKGNQVGQEYRFKKGKKNWLNRNPKNLNFIESQFKKGHKLNVGRKCEQGTKEKIRVKQQGKRGHNWRDGSSFEPYGIEFNNKLKEQIRKRDYFICQECGLPEEHNKYKLAVHHIDYDKNNNNPENLISLCNRCHCITGFKRKDWISHYKRKMGVKYEMARC